MEADKRNVYWPAVTDLPAAISASDQGYWSAVGVAVLTGFSSAIALFRNSDLAGVNGWSFIDAAVFGMIAWRIRRRSRIFAVAGLCLFIAEKVLQAIVVGQFGIAGLFVSGFIILLFINGIRGTFAIHRLVNEVVPDPPSRDRDL